MHPAAATVRLLSLLAANGSWRLDCVCRHINDTDSSDLSAGESLIWWTNCDQANYYWLPGPCESLETPSIAVPALARVARPSWWGDYGPEPPAEVDPPPAGDGGCGGALSALGDLTFDEVRNLGADLPCSIAADYIRSCSVLGLNDTKWNLTTLSTDYLRRPILSQLLHAVRCVTRAIEARTRCETYGRFDYLLRFLNNSEFLEHRSIYWRDVAQLLSDGVTRLSQLFVPLAFELMGNNMNNQQLQGWIKNVERVRDMLHTKLSGWIQDAQYASLYVVNYMAEESKTSPGTYILRRPLLSEDLLEYQQPFLTFLDDFTEHCRELQPQASQMLSLDDALYVFCHESWFQNLMYFERIYELDVNVTDEEWQLEDRSNETLTVDTGCMQLLAHALDHPRCPLEDLPPETIERRKQCRLQLWDDMVQRSPHIPVTSYLAYTQRASVHLCLLAWMAVNSFSICQDVPFSMMQSVHDARCYFDSRHNKSCLNSNATEAICSVSRAILLLKCRDFISSETNDLCRVNLHANGSLSTADMLPADGESEKPTERAMNYKHSLTHTTLKYKDFKIDSLKPLEISFVAVNLFFRFLTAGVYVHIPQLRNLPGKILLTFQITGITQILFSEVVYRMTGVPALSAMVLIDSALTFFSCIWLNLFCYQMYACVRHLRLPNELSPAEASIIFRRQVLYALIPLSIVCTACATLETTSKHFLIYSRIVFLVGISLSIAFNLVCLGLIGYMYLRNRYSMNLLRIYSEEKFASKKQLVFMSAKTVILSGIGIIIRIGFHQAQGIAQFVYWVHIATMMQGPVLFILFVCNETTLPVLRKKLLACCNAEIASPDQELCSAAERNLRRRRNEETPAAESSV